NATGKLLNSTTITTSAAPSALLVDTRAALISDTAVYGATSPILGERYRVSVAPTFGSVTFTTITADYRRYAMPIRAFTIAVRLMHVGRYGSGADDPRLLPLMWTLRDVVRGYGDVGPDGTSTEYLTASRLVVGNIELRFPVPGAFHRRADSGSLPIEGLIFT